MDRVDATLLGRAIRIAATEHARQIDKRGLPYILHPLRVMDSVRAAGYPVEHQIAAVLHDVLEDTYCTRHDLELELGAHVDRPGQHIEICDAVDALSRRFEPGGHFEFDEFGARKWKEPLETHWEYFLRCVEDPIGRVVKYFDTLDNMNPRRFDQRVPYSRYLKVLAWYEENNVRP